MIICEILVRRLRFVYRNIAKCKAVFSIAKLIYLDSKYRLEYKNVMYLGLLWTNNAGACFCSVNIGGCLKVSPSFSVLLGDSTTRSRRYGDLVGASSRKYTAVKTENIEGEKKMKSCLG